MYQRVNRSCSIILPLIKVVLLVSFVSSQHLHIIPNNFTDVCPNYQNETVCLTLAELALNTSRLDQTNLTLNFLPGDHVLAQRVIVNSTINLVLTGHICNASQCETKIKCQGTSGFELQNVHNINITGLEFSGCGGDKINGGVLDITNVTFLSVLSCYFVQNRVSGVRALGGAVYIHTAFDVSIHNSYFINNSAECIYNSHQSCYQPSVLNVGGAIFIVDTRKSVFINSCHFEHNRAFMGGAIASKRSTLVAIYATFVYNQADSDTIGFGGAIYSENTNLTVISDQFTSNVAEMDGGAISISESLLFISDSDFTNNIARRAGGAVSVRGESNLSSSDTYFNNNAAQYGGAVYIIQSSLAEASVYYSNNEAKNGGAVCVEEGNISNLGCYYTHNNGKFGGAISLFDGILSSNNAHHNNNSAIKGGAVYMYRGSLSTSKDNYTYNTALRGGAIFAKNGSISTWVCDFENNKAGWGGAIRVEQGTISTSETNYISNLADVDGGAISTYESYLSSTNDSFENNNASNGGGAISSYSSSLFSSNSCFLSNKANAGGAINSYDGNIMSNSSVYESNNAVLYGGAMYASDGIIMSNNSQYKMNKAGSLGGAICFFTTNSTSSKVETTKNYLLGIIGSSFSNNEAGQAGGALLIFALDSASVIGSEFKNNHASNGGAILVEESSTFCTFNNFTNNSAEDGGAIVVINASMFITFSYYTNNRVAQLGGAIRVIEANVSTSDSHYANNSAFNGGVIYINGSSSVSSSYDTFTENSAYSHGGAICGNTSSISSKNSTYSNNIAQQGGVIYMEYSIISIVSSYYEMNRATVLGGAISILHANISISESYFENNKATFYGGSMYVEKGNISISGGYYSDNQAEGGGVIFVEYGSVHITSCLFSDNKATVTGGVMFADTSSINSEESNYTSNRATIIGGVFTISQSSLQTSQSYYTNNTAIQSGGVIYSQCLESSHTCTFVSVGNYYISNSAQAGGSIRTATYNINVTNDYYSYNSAVDGGAMIVKQGTMSISETSFSNNSASFGGGGGAIHTVYSSLSISDTHFTNNTASGGGALYCHTTSLSMLHSNYTNNQAQDGGAILIGYGIVVTCSNSFFVSNAAFAKGGAISVTTGNFVSRDCHFKDNQAIFQGGAIQIREGNVSIVNSIYANNEAGGLTGGAIYVEKGSVSTSGSSYTSNRGGTILIDIEGSIFSSDSYYVNNTGKIGGAMYVYKGNVFSNRSQYTNNFAQQGGAIYVYRGNVTCVNSSFKFNRAVYGGAILAWTNNIVSSTGCEYEDNISSRFGGAICSYSGNYTGAVTSYNSNYTNNYSDLGGAVFVIGGNISNMNSNYVNNTAGRAGGAICALLSNIYSTSSYFGNNYADEHGGAIFTDSCTHTNNLSLFQPHKVDDRLDLLFTSIKLICNENIYLDIPGLFSAELEFSGSTIFTNNSCGLFGGAIVSIQVKIFFNGRVSAVVSDNAAAYGGGLALHAGSTLSIHSPIEVQFNKATKSGGGIFSYMSDIDVSLQGSRELTSISNNIVSENGGGVYVVDSYIKITHGIMLFENNVASKGAAISLEQNSKIFLQKERQLQEMFTMGKYDLKLNFIDNHAQYGGAVYIPDSREGVLACERGIPGSDLAQSSQECSFQTLLLNTTVSDDSTKANYINIFFVNNTASVSGGAIYGGLFDRCILNHTAELVTHFPQYQQSTGFDYIRATAQFAGLFDYDNLTFNYHPDKLINAITSADVEGLISSEPVQVCFCLENVQNCSYDHPNVFTKKGQLFRLSVVAVDQVGNPINATVISSFVSNNGDLNVDQTRQETTTRCTELEYNVYPKGDSKSSEIELYAEGPCKDIGISKRTLTVTFLPCTCPIGFQPSETETLCSCECDSILRPTYISNCSYANETVLRDSNAWIDYVNTTTKAGYLLYGNCPYDYCVDTPVNINLNVPNGADIQCAFNRSGKLCGECKKNLSLVMGSSRCQECSNSFISLIIPFALAGIALVAFILILNVTVATGTIHGLIFFANILVASRSAFIPFDTPNILIIFIAWINLDLGIDTCFYNGMNAYAKVLLQMAFPTYIILITITIIIISEYSIRFSTLIGKKDPVATLCTLILLSYSKLIRTIIASLQYTHIDYPDGSREIVWLYNANVPYFSPSHIPRFITSIVIIILGSVYTVLIFFGQWITRCGNRRFLRCFNNPKYNEFIRKYHAPFNPKHRYWVGLLLFARIFHYIVSAFVADTAILLSVICIVVGLVIIKLMSTVITRTSTYNYWLFDSLEVTFLLNLVIFTAATYYVGESGGSQLALATTSLGLSFIIFLGILVYHFYAYILKNTQCWGRLVQLLQGIAQICKKRNEHVRVPLEEDQGNVDGDNEEDEQMIEMQPPYTDNNDTDSIDLPLRYDPPVIVPAVRYDQLREPDLDILDPITTDDYRELNQPPGRRPRQVPTTTVIDVVKK